MPRKFKLHRQKNDERRRSSRKLREEQEENTERSNTEAPDTLRLSQLSIPSCNWNKQISEAHQSILFYKVTHIQATAELNSTPLKITKCLKIYNDFSWSLFVHNHLLDTTKCNALKSVPQVLNPKVIADLFAMIDSLSVCAGHYDIHFVQMVLSKKGKIMSPSGNIAAYVDDCITEVDGKIFLNTVRTSKCELLCTSIKCASCKAYRTNLRVIHNRWSKQSESLSIDTTSHINHRYLNTPQMKAKIDALRNRAHTAEEEVKRLEEKVHTLSAHGDEVDTDLEVDLIHIMNENTDDIRKRYGKGTFARLLWDEQLKAATAKNPRQIRWHPMLIKWCLNLKLLSNSAYNALRTTGFLTLPSERTLRDYIHYFSNNAGFQNEVHQQLLEELNLLRLPETKKYVSLIIDEMKIKDGLVYNKQCGKVIGFADFGDINNELMQLEKSTEHPPIATHVLVLMVRGLFFKLEFPYAHFATEGVSADTLYPIVWEAVRRLEIDGVKVMCITADGGSSNRKFFSINE